MPEFVGERDAFDIYIDYTRRARPTWWLVGRKDRN
jgi:hypothetical protein